MVQSQNKLRYRMLPRADSFGESWQKKFPIILLVDWAHRRSWTKSPRAKIGNSFIRFKLHLAIH